MKRKVALVLIVLFFMPSLACGWFTTNSLVGSGQLVNQSIEVDSFSEVTLEGFGTVFITQGETESLSIQIDENLLALLDISVKGKELTLGVKPGYTITPTQSISFNVTVQDLTAIGLDGSGDFYVEPLKSDSLAVSIRGSGDIDIQGLTAHDLSIDLSGSGKITIQDIAVKTVETSLQGSGDIKLEGQAEKQKATVGGSGNYLAEDLETTAADVSIPGSGDVTVWANEILTIHVNGSGNIRYFGHPAIDQSGSGSGDLISLGEK